MTARERLAVVYDEAKKLNATGILDSAGNTKMADLLSEANQLKAQVENEVKLAALDEYASKSTGMPPMAAPTKGADLVGMTPAGSAEVGWDRRATKSSGRKLFGMEVLEQYGEGMWDSAQVKATGTTEYAKALAQYLRKKGELSFMNLDATKTLQEGSDTAGGFAVPLDVLDRVVAKAPTPTRVAGRVTQLTTMRDQLVMPKVVYTTDDLYTTGMRVTWTGEIPASATTSNVTDPIFGQISIPIYTAMMQIPITNDLIEDASFPLVSYITGKFGETIDLLKDNMIENGSGIGQPSGILINPGADNTQPSTVVSTSASTITAAGLVNLAFSLPEQYDDNAAFVMNKTNVGKVLAGLTDSYGRYIWSYGFQDSGLSPDWHGKELLGYPILWSGFMPNVGSNTFPVIFGDLQGYYLVNRIGLSVQVLREISAQTNQVVILGRIRFGGVTAEPWRLKIQKCST